MGTGEWFIRATKEFGFPIVFGLVMLWMFSGLMGDYRESVKSCTLTNSKLAMAVESLKGDADDKTKAIESQTRALWELKRNSDENLKLHVKMGDKLDRLGDSFDRVATGLRAVGSAEPPKRPQAPPMPQAADSEKEKPQ